MFHFHFHENENDSLNITKGVALIGWLSSKSNALYIKITIP